MLTILRAFSGLVASVFRPFASLAIALCALGLAGFSVACALGYAQWLTLSVQFGTTGFTDVGMVVQLCVTAFFLALCVFLPTNARIMSLEHSHRRFEMGMRDVSRAYHAAHAADRTGTFTLQSEFDSVRERLLYLRDHPDLSDLEPAVLELAAQMSHVSGDLAKIYSDRQVSRARDFLLQRQYEIEEFNTRLDAAKAVVSELRPWLARIEIEEDVARSQLKRLSDELIDILPELPLAAEDTRQPDLFEHHAFERAALAQDQPTADAQEGQIIQMPERRAAE